MPASNRSPHQYRYKVIAPADLELGLQGYEYDLCLTISSSVSSPVSLFYPFARFLEDFFPDSSVLAQYDRRQKSPLLQQVVNE